MYSRRTPKPTPALSRLMTEKTASRPLPSFRQPPVIEVVLGVQFEELLDLTTAKIGSLWTRYRDEFPKTQDHPPLDPVSETFDDHLERVSVRLEPLNKPPRVWFLNATEDHVIQVQQDRFVVNWRKRDGQEYPRFGHVLALFSSSFERFLNFIRDEGIEALTANQCEVTYVNHIPAGKGWNVGEVDKVISAWSGSFGDTFLRRPEITRIQNGFNIAVGGGEPLGRLRTDLQTIRTRDGQDGIVLNITARGRPTTRDTNGILAFFELGREWVVRTFTSYTTPAMHTIWERYE